MFRYNYTKVVNSDKMDSELKDSQFPYSHLETKTPDQVYIWMTQELSSMQESALTSYVMTHNTVVAANPVDVLTNRILNAMAFGRGLIAQYGAQNILSGLSIEEIQDIMSRTQGVQVALNTGSLYVAIDELNKVQTDDRLITTAIVKNFRNKIEDYLNIPRT